MRPRAPLTHVAIRFQGTVYSLPAPNRHHDVIRKIVAETGVDTVDTLGDDQGFLDADGNYLRRGQAMVSAAINGQLKDPAVKRRDLFSEDVW